MDDRIAAIIRERALEGTLHCAASFCIAEELVVTPLAEGQTADTLGVRLSHCQLCLFGHDEHKLVVKLAKEGSPELEQAIREGLILGRLPCAVAWAIAARFEVPKLRVANAAEKLDVRIGQCQLGAF